STAARASPPCTWSRPMTAPSLEKTSGTSPTAAAPGAATRPRITGLACKNCQRPEVLGPNFVCPACFGPLEVVYDYDVIAGRVSREPIAARPAGIWRYQELLPTSSAPARGLAVGSSPLVEAPRLGDAIGIDNLRLK